MVGRHHNPRKLLLLSLFSSKAIVADARKSSRKFLVLCALVLVLLLVLRTSSSSFLSLHDPQVYHGAFIGRRSLGTGAIMQAHIVEQPEHVRTDGSGKYEVRDKALYCDRSHVRTDVCVARGDVRVVGGQRGADRLYEVVVYAEAAEGREREERVKPYTRKWEESVMQTIDEVKLLRKVVHNNTSRNTYAGHAVENPTCDVQHTVPAILFSTGGYTGNVYHEFNDGLIPLFLTAQPYGPPPGQLVLVLLEYHDWWISKYAEILGQITNYTIVDLANDKRVHCFSEVTVGLRIHGELSINDPHLHALGPSMAGFQAMLNTAYLPRLTAHADNVSYSTELPALPSAIIAKKPKLVIISRDGSRALLNQQQVVALAQEIGFEVQVLSPTPTTEMVEIYGALNGCHAMLGVHGAAMTHLVFMRPGATFIQVVPLGTDWAAATYYGEPARKLGLHYVEYKVSPRESSLWEQYARGDPVLVDPDTVNSRGWDETKRIYLQAQNVTVSLSKMGLTLRSAYARATMTRPLAS